MIETLTKTKGFPGPQSQRWLPPTGLAVDQVRPLAATGALVLLDVRDQEAYLSGHIPGSIHAPDSNPARLVAEVERHPRVVLVCDTGSVSRMVARTLKFSGRADPAYLVGGLRAWTAAGLSLLAVSETGQKHRVSPETHFERATRRIAPVARSLNRRVLFASLAGSAVVLGFTLLMLF